MVLNLVESTHFFLHYFLVIYNEQLSWILGIGSSWHILSYYTHKNSSQGVVGRVFLSLIFLISNCSGKSAYKNISNESELHILW